VKDWSSGEIPKLTSQPFNIKFTLKLHLRFIVHNLFSVLQSAKMSTLRADVYVAPPIAFKRPDGKDGGFWSPITSTLIHGDKEAILVDTPITISQTKDLADWIEKVLGGRKRLTTIYITHGHGDHWFGIPYLVKRFPGVEAVAMPAVISHMKNQINPDTYKKTWGSQFPGQIDEEFKLPRPLPGNELVLEGHMMQVVEVGQADTHDSTILWVPDIRLAVCGDVVYGDVHQMLGEANTRDKREGWISSIRKVEALKPEIVVAGHKRAGEVDGTYHLAESRKYIETFQALLDGGAKDARELSRLMLDRYPTRYNPGALIIGCINAFKRSSNKL
jgi:glyoxylase-like metal-dependent hydrolase (beta-lactamase superfamily II)